jgi:hypothetical protein
VAEHGGYRKPANPAPVSGPGAHSKRTDGGVSHQALSAVPDQGYGEQKAQLDAQRQAPMAGAAPMPQAAPVPQGGGGAGASMASDFDFAGPSQRPDEPITHGVDIGPGAGPEALTFQPTTGQPDGYLTNLLGSLSPTDRTGTLAQLYQIAKQRGV